MHEEMLTNFVPPVYICNLLSLLKGMLEGAFQIHRHTHAWAYSIKEVACAGEFLVRGIVDIKKQLDCNLQLILY